MTIMLCLSMIFFAVLAGLVLEWLLFEATK